RAGNEFLFQQLALQNIETLNSVFEGVEQRKRKIVVTCAHCFNALGNEYPEVGGQYEVVHHTQLLNRLVRQKKLIPVASVQEDVTYHDPCFLGRHNKVYDAPRELMAASGSTLKEMPRHGERSMCCGAGGARMWMEENIGKRINVDRVDEALSTDTKKIATGCPFCRVMLNDGVTARQESGQGEGVEVVDVAQLMLSSITRLEPDALTENIKVIPREKPAEAAEAKAETVEQDRVEEVEEAAEAPAKAAPAGGGLAMKGGGKTPGAKAPGGGGLAMKGGGKTPGAKAPGGGGLAMKGGGKAPGAKASAPADAAASDDEKPKGPPAAKGGLAMKGGGKAPGGGLQMKGAGKAPGAKAPAAPATADSTEATASEAPAAEKPKGPPAAKGGLAMKGAAKAPGARKPAPAAAAPSSDAGETEAPKAEEPKAEAPKAEAPKAPPAAKNGLGFKGGAKAPGAGKTAPAAAAAPAAEPREDEPKAEPEAPAAEKEAPTPPPAAKGGLGFKSGAKPPGKK
ncbi:MAG: (Fe-S)-binding protein, partial [Rhodococcus sp.]|nr:(Fe-S)-binding protein [Rhodococcus sp. (in: high G+C Gram-positive bacteria)]